MSRTCVALQRKGSCRASTVRLPPGHDPDAVTQAHEHLDTAPACLTEIRTAPTSAFAREDAEHPTERLLRSGHIVDATVLHALRLLTPHARQSDIVDFLSTSPRNLSRYTARKYGRAAKLTDPDTPWNGAVGGVNGDRGALVRLGPELSAGETSLAHVLHAADALTSLPTPVRRGPQLRPTRTPTPPASPGGRSARPRQRTTPRRG